MATLCCLSAHGSWADHWKDRSNGVAGMAHLSKTHNSHPWQVWEDREHRRVCWEGVCFSRRKKLQEIPPPPLVFEGPGVCLYSLSPQCCSVFSVTKEGSRGDAVSLWQLQKGDTRSCLDRQIATPPPNSKKQALRHMAESRAGLAGLLGTVTEKRSRSRAWARGAPEQGTG